MKTVMSVDLGENKAAHLDQFNRDYIVSIWSDDNVAILRGVDEIEALYDFLARVLWEIR